MTQWVSHDFCNGFSSFIGLWEYQALWFSQIDGFPIMIHLNLS